MSWQAFSRYPRISSCIPRNEHQLHTSVRLCPIIFDSISMISCYLTSVAFAFSICSTTIKISLHKSHGTVFWNHKVDHIMTTSPFMLSICPRSVLNIKMILTIWGLLHTFCWQWGTAPHREAVFTFWHQYWGPRAHCSVPSRGVATAETVKTRLRPLNNSSDRTKVSDKVWLAQIKWRTGGGHLTPVFSQ